MSDVCTHLLPADQLPFDNLTDGQVLLHDLYLDRRGGGGGNGPP